MSDTIAPMRWSLVLLVACSGDPTLHVTVEHPAGLAVTKTVVSVYESTAIDCEQIEFGDITGEPLHALLVAEQTLIPNAPSLGALDGLSRVDPKYVVARGFGSDGKLLAAGCAEKAEVVGDDRLTVTTVVAATASVSLVDPTRKSDVYGLIVTTTDPMGRAIVGRPVSWRVYGPIGTAPAASSAQLVAVGDPADSVWQPALPTCTQGGAAPIHPVPPNLTGGYAIQARVAWAADPIPLYSSFNAKAVLSPLTPPANVSKFCAIGRTGTTSALVCLDAGTARPYAVMVNGGNVTLTPQGAAIPLTNPIGVYAVPNGPDIDVYAMSSAGVATRVYGSSTAATCSVPLGTCSATLALDDVMVAPACGGAPAKLIVHDQKPATTNQVKWVDLQGGLVSDFPVVVRAMETGANASLNSAGCTTELATDQAMTMVRQVVVVDFGRLNQTLASRAHFACSAGSCSTLELPIAGAGVGFTGDAQPSLIGTAVDATGVVLTSWIIAVTGNGTRFLELDREPSASLPDRIATGQFDNDGGLDKVWDLKTKAGTLIEVGYSRLVGDQPLAALAFDLQLQSPPIDVLDLIVGDTNGDGFDDVVLAGSTIEAVPRFGVVVVPTRVTAPTGPLPTDPTCAP
jgi:hypothetical protein